jgi:hypothetical protein
MRTATFLSAGALMLALTGWVSAPEVSAQVTLPGVLGVGPGSTDFFGVTCHPGSLDLRATVTDSPGVDGVIFGVCVLNNRGGGRCNIAPDGGNAQAVSNSGAGQYNVTVFKAAPLGNAAGVETYQITSSCTGALTTAIPLQNQ